MTEHHPPSDATSKLLTNIVNIRQTPEGRELAFTLRELVHCTLPYRDPGDVPVWRRQNGELFLGIRPGVDLQTTKTLGIPYGSIPRLLLFWLTTEAVRNKSRRVDLGRSYSDFVEKVGLSVSTGRGARGDATRLRNQMTRLFCASIQFQHHQKANGVSGFEWRGFEVSAGGQLWWDPKTPDQLAIFSSWVELGEYFYAMATKAPVPVDLRALKVLKQSPLALDLYVWTSYKSLIAARSGRPQTIAWHDFMLQFGTEYKRPDNFQKAVMEKLKIIQQLYPELRIGEFRGGLTILPTSRPAIPLQDPHI